MATKFTTTKSWSEGDVTGKRRVVLEGTLVTDGTDGAVPNSIPASIFLRGQSGLRILEEALPLVRNDNNAIVVVAPAFDGKSLLGRAAGTNSPANVPAGTYKATVKGY